MSKTADKKNAAPRIKPGAMSACKLHRAKEKDMKRLGYPEQRVDNWREAFLEKFAQLLEERRQLKVFMDACVRCGACSESCQFFLGSGDPGNIPFARAELLRSVYRRYFTPAGKLFKAGRELNEELLDEMYTYYYQCSMCRRCSVFCPFGIDTAEITWAAREIMTTIGVAPKYTTEVLCKLYDFGNNMGIPPAAWADTAEFLHDDIEDEMGISMAVPIDEEGADVLLIPPSGDMFANAGTAMGYIKFFHAAGISWTTSSWASEAGNFGMFLTYRDMKLVNRRLVEACRRLKPKLLVIGECGHAWRAATMATENCNGPLPEIDGRKVRMLHIAELMTEVMNGEQPIPGAVVKKPQLDKNRNDGQAVTLHEPCNLSRAGSGGLLGKIRTLLSMCVNDIREMPAGTTGEKTFCCGAGNGLLSDEIMPVRIAGGKPRADAVKACGANVVAAPCAICKAQLPSVFQHFDMEVEIKGVIELFTDAIVYEEEQKDK